MRPLFLLACALLLAGCSGQAPPESKVTVITDPTDLSYLNGTDSGFHVHDYWRGGDRLGIVDQQRSFMFLVGGGSRSATTIVPEDGVVVPQGTASVEMTLSWTESSPVQEYGRIELWVRTQQHLEHVLVGEAVNGGMLTYTTTHADADLPHQAISAWEFLIAIYSPDGQPSQPLTGQARTFDLDFALQAEAVRGLDLPVFPPHPDHWNNATELALVVAAQGNTQLWMSEPPSCTYCSGGITIVRADEGSIVPYDAAAVEVTFTNSAETPTRLRLLYHGADTREWQEAPVTSEEGNTRVHRIPVQGTGDGPYADQSLWAFYFAFEGGDGPYRGEWTLSAKVLRQA